MKWSKKAVSIMLSLAMVITTLSLPLPSVKAETQAMEPETKATNARTIFIAGKEGSGDYDPSMGYYGQIWYYNDGYTELSDGQTVWQDHGQNMDNNAKAKFTYGETWSILELDGYQTYGTAGYLFLKGLAQDRYFYGIYYDGNLEIILKDENMIEAYNTDTLDCLYGIYVTGDLLIISETGDHKGSLDINMHGNKNETVRGLEYGIYCGGKFMVAGSGDYPRIDAKVGAVTGALSSSIGVQSCGIHCKTYSQTGGKVTGRTDKVKWSYGVAASNITVSGGTLIGKGLAPEGDTTYGIRARGNINVSGGRVIGQAGDNETQADRVYGIYIDGGESVFSGGEVLGQAYKANLGCGIQTGGFTLPDYSDATVTGLGSACAKDYNYGIRVYGEGEAASVTISGGNVHAVGGETSDSYGKAYGMYVYNANLTIDQTGVLSATAGDSHDSYGLYVSSLEVKDQGLVEAHAGYTMDDSSYGIYVSDTFRMAGGNVVATACEESSQYNNTSHSGIELSYAEDIQFTGGNVTCDGGYGYGMKLKNASLYIEDGEVTAKGQSAAFSLYNDATVTAALYQGSLNYDGSDSEMTTQFNPEWKNVFASGKQLYTMSFEANGGTGEMESVMVVEGETFSLPTCGFTPPSGDAQFYGWEVSGSDQMYHEGDMIDNVSEDMTFTAAWFEPIIMDYVAAAFDGKLGMAFYVSLPECLKYDQNAYVTFTQNGETTKKPLAGVFESGKNASGLYRIAFYMPAAYYRDQVTMRFFDGNDELLKIKGKSTGNDLTSTGVNYSLEKYVNKIKDNPDEKVKNLARAMDDYCTAAQIYFEHPTAGVTLTLSSAVSGVTQSQLEGYKAVRNGSLPSSITGVTLTASFEADNTLKLGLNFKENKKPSGIKYYISEDGTFDHAKATSVRGDATNGYHLAVRNVPAAYLGKSYTFFIVNEKDTSSNNMYSIRCSIFTYARATAFNSTYSENLRNLTKAMYLYGKAAEAYFNVTN